MPTGTGYIAGINLKIEGVGYLAGVDKLPVSCTRLAYMLDGVDDYISFTPVNLAIGESAGVKVKGWTATASFQTIMDSPSSLNRIAIRAQSGGTWEMIGCTATFDGVPLNNGEPVNLDGNEHSIVITATINGQIDRFGENFAQTSPNISGYFYDGYIGSTDFWKMDDNSATLVNHINPANPATIQNHTASQWQVIGCNETSYGTEYTEEY